MHYAKEIVLWTFIWYSYSEKFESLDRYNMMWDKVKDRENEMLNDSLVVKGDIIVDMQKD